MSVETNTDSVISALALPAGAKLNGFNLQVSVLSTALGVKKAAVYGLHGYVLPILDPDSPWDPDTIWDTQVPKDQAIVLGTSDVDLDTQAVNAEPHVDIGQISVETMVNSTTAPVQVFDRQRVMTWANSPQGGFEDAQADFIVSDYFTTKVDKNIRVIVPSVLLLGFSSPDTLSTSTGWTVPDSDADWMRLQYAEESLHQAMVEVMEGHDPGAESPWEDALQLLGTYLEQAVEENAGSYSPQTFTVFTNLTGDVTVPGSFEKSSLTAQPT